MTPEIDARRAEYEAADDVLRTARINANAAEAALNQAVCEWAKNDLVSRGIILGKTPVNVQTRRFSNDRWLGEKYICMSVSARDGVPSYGVAKIKKDGTPSAASSGIYGQVIAVRIPAP
jgi:hypothetical protein